MGGGSGGGGGAISRILLAITKSTYITKKEIFRVKYVSYYKGTIFCMYRSTTYAEWAT